VFFFGLIDNDSVEAESVNPSGRRIRMMRQICRVPVPSR